GIVAAQLVQTGAVDIGAHKVGGALDRLIVVREGLALIAQLLGEVAAVVVGEGVGRVELECALVVGDGAGHIALGVPGHSALEIGPNIGGVALDQLGKVADRVVVVAALSVG